MTISHVMRPSDMEQALEECARRGIDPHELCADGGVETWMIVAKERHREPIQPGQYGRVEVIDSASCARFGAAFIDVINPHLGMTADELREAAHMFNQIAEVLEQEL